MLPVTTGHTRPRVSASGGVTALPVVFATNFAKQVRRTSKGFIVTHNQLIVGLVLLVMLYLTTQWMQFQQMASKAPYVATGTVSRRSGSRRLKEPKHPFPELQNLVIVACHAVFTGFDYTKTDDPNNWFLLEYQKYPQYPQSFMKHIELGVGELARDPKALMLFSGGKTRKTAGPRSEGESYWLLAEAAGWYGNKEVRERTFTEEHARDSFENLMFSLCRFYELTGHAPSSVTMIGYEFKRRRFIELHRAAMRYPADRFQYIGTPALTPDAEVGEARAAAAFQTDPYGCRGELLSKKEERDPFAQGPYADNRCPPLEPLLDYCGETVYKGLLPWDNIGIL